MLEYVCESTNLFVVFAFKTETFTQARQTACTEEPTSAGAYYGALRTYAFFYNVNNNPLASWLQGRRTPYRPTKNIIIIIGLTSPFHW